MHLLKQTEKSKHAADLEAEGNETAFVGREFSCSLPLKLLTAVKQAARAKHLDVCVFKKGQRRSNVLTLHYEDLEFRIRSASCHPSSSLQVSMKTLRKL